MAIVAKCLGLQKFDMSRSRDGVRSLRATYLVEVRDGTPGNSQGPWGAWDLDPDNESDDIFEDNTPDPTFILSAEGLPRPGDTWLEHGLGRESALPPAVDDEDTEPGELFCGWDRRVRPYRAGPGERARFYTVVCTFTENLQATTLGNIDSSTYKSGNTRAANWDNVAITGGQSRQTKRRVDSYAGCPIKDFHMRANDSSALNSAMSYLTVEVTQNYGDQDDFQAYRTSWPSTVDGLRTVNISEFGDVDLNQQLGDLSAVNTFKAHFGVEPMLTKLSFALNKVNAYPMWGFPARHIKLENVTWDVTYSVKSGQPILKTRQTYKIAPPWETQIPSGNAESLYRPSYGFDNPQIIFATDFLDKSAFEVPEASKKTSRQQAEFDLAHTGTVKLSEEGAKAVKRPYRRPLPGFFKIPQSDAYRIGNAVIQNPGDAYWDNQTGRTQQLPSFEYIWIPGLGWYDYETFAFDTDLWRQAFVANGLNENSEAARLSLKNWLFWNPITLFDASHKTFDYDSFTDQGGIYGANTPEKSPSKTINVALKNHLSDEWNPSTQSWEPTTYPPSVYTYDETGNWTQSVIELSEEANKRVAEKGHPIWVNTIAQADNFHKWPGMPFVPGQDISEMQVYPALDAAFDFQSEFNLPEIPVLN